MPTFSPEKRTRSFRMLGWAVLLIAGLLVWTVLLRTGEDPGRAWRALLVNFLYFTSLSAGLVTWSAIVVAANGRWAGPAERLAWTGVGFFIPSLIILGVLWIGSPDWAPWYGRKLHQGAWLNNSILFLRVLAGLLIFWGAAIWFLVTRFRGRLHAGGSAAALIIVYCVVFTFFAFDLVMALTPEWRSALFGAYFFISSLYLGAVFWAFLAVADTAFSREIRQDLGKLILAFSILTTSFLFMQLLTIWYENMPEETSYLIDRMHYRDWMAVTAFLLVVVYFGPLLLLVTERAKKSRVFLGAVSILLLVGLWVERWWLVAPSFSHEAKFGMVELAATAAFFGGLALSVETARAYLPAMPKEEVIKE